MARYRLVYISLLLIVILVSVHMIALFLSLYWTLWWFDIPMHILGALSVTTFILFWYVLYRSLDSRPLSLRKLFITTVSTALLLGVAWEVFEHVNGLAETGREGYLQDTLLDLFGDFIGGALAFFMLLPHKKFVEKSLESRRRDTINA